MIHRFAVRALSACALTLFVALTPAHSSSVAGHSACLTIEQLRAVVATSMPAARLLLLDGEQASLFLSGFNAISPRSNVSASVVLVVLDENEGLARLGFAVEGCVAATGVVSLPAIRRLLLDTIGKEA